MAKIAGGVWNIAVVTETCYSKKNIPIYIHLDNVIIKTLGV